MYWKCIVIDQYHGQIKKNLSKHKIWLTLKPKLMDMMAELENIYAFLKSFIFWILQIQTNIYVGVNISI